MVGLRPRLAAVGVRDVADAADLHARAHGHRRRVHHAGDACRSSPTCSRPRSAAARSRSGPRSPVSASRSDRSAAASCSQHFYWGSIFLVNLPIVVVALIAGVFLIPNVEGPVERQARLVGAVLSIVGLVSLVYAIIEAPRDGWTSATILGAFGVLGRRARAVRAVGARSRAPDARRALLQEPALHAPRARHHADLLRDVRLDVPAHAVLPVRHGLLAAAGRACGCCRGRSRCSSSRR